MRFQVRSDPSPCFSLIARKNTVACLCRLQSRAFGLSRQSLIQLRTASHPVRHFSRPTRGKGGTLSPVLPRRKSGRALAHGSKNRLRLKTNFVSRFNLLWPVQSLYVKILLPFFRNMCLSPRIPIPQEGHFGQSSRTLGAGCDGRFGAHMTKRADADGENVWS